MNVLVVDDTVRVRTRVAAMLAEIPGIEAVFVASGSADTLEALRDHAPEVVVLDLQLRGESALSLVPHVRRERPAALLVVLTNQPSEQGRRRCLALGADHFFDKSMGFEALRSLVAHASGRR